MAFLILFLVLALAALFTRILLGHLDSATAAERRLWAHPIAEAGLEAAVPPWDQGNGFCCPSLS